MTITNDTQAEAARKKLEALQEYAEAFGLPFSYGTLDTPPRIYNAYDSSSEEVQIRTALAAYEQSKIELSEDELVMLKYQCINWGESNRWYDAVKTLKRKKLLESSGEPAPAGRAYLEKMNSKQCEVREVR